MKVKVNMEVEKLIALFIGTQGEWNGSQMEYFPELPECFTNNLDFQCSCGCNADFLRLENYFNKKQYYVVFFRNYTLFIIQIT